MKTTFFSTLGVLVLIFLTCNNCQQNTPPIASISGESTSFVGDKLMLDGSGSSDAETDSLIFNWSVISGPDKAGEVLHVKEAGSCYFVPDAGGSYTIELIVNDGTIDSDPATLDIEVIDFHGTWALISRTPSPTPAEMIDTVVYNDDGTFEYYSWYKYQGKSGLTYKGKGKQDSPVGQMEYLEYTMPVPPSMEIQTFTPDNDPLGILKRMNTPVEGAGEGEYIYVLSDGGNSLTTKSDGNNDGDFDDIEEWTGTNDLVTVWKRVK